MRGFKPCQIGMALRSALGLGLAEQIPLYPSFGHTLLVQKVLLVQAGDKLP
jgi:hypothetical protein